MVDVSRPSDVACVRCSSTSWHGKSAVSHSGSVKLAASRKPTGNRAERDVAWTLEGSASGSDALAIFVSRHTSEMVLSNHNYMLQSLFPVCNRCRACSRCSSSDERENHILCCRCAPHAGESGDRSCSPLMRNAQSFKTFFRGQWPCRKGTDERMA